MLNEQDQKEYDYNQKHKPTSYIPDHLKPHGGLRGKALFKRLMGGSEVTIIGSGDDDIQIIGDNYQDEFYEKINEEVEYP